MNFVKRIRQYYMDDKTKEKGMGGACSTLGR